MIGLQPGDTIAVAIATGGSIQYSASGLNTTTGGVSSPDTWPAGTVAPSAITTILTPTGSDQYSVTDLTLYNAGTSAILTVYRQPSGGSQVIACAGVMAAGDCLLYGPSGWQHFNSAMQIVGSGGGISLSGVPTNEQTIVWNSTLGVFQPGFSRSYVTRTRARATWR